MDSKPWWQSKTLWFNVLVGTAGVVGALPPNEYTVAAVGLVNIVLRGLTSQALGSSPK